LTYVVSAVVLVNIRQLLYAVPKKVAHQTHGYNFVSS